MNKVTIVNQQEEKSELKGGEIFQHSGGAFHIVSRTHFLSETTPFLLTSLHDGNPWSHNSLFGDSESDFKRVYGTVTITTE